MQKDFSISNVKGLLIFLVVFGHFIELYSGTFKNIYLLIYAVHMPLFVLISGYLSKRPSLKKAVNFLVLFFIFQFIYGLYYKSVNPNLPVQFTVPYFHLWYLISMAGWMLLLLAIRLFTSLKAKILLFTCLALAGIFSRQLLDQLLPLLSPYLGNVTSYHLSIQRTFTFLPLFLLGYYMDKNNFEKAKTLFKRWKGLAVLLVVVSVLLVISYFPSNWEALFKGAVSYRAVNDYQPIAWQKGIMLGLAHLIISFLLALVILNVSKNKPTLLTRWGNNSLPIYLFHPFGLFIYQKFLAVHVAALNSATILAAIFIISLAITAALSSPIIQTALKPILTPVDFLLNTIAKHTYRKAIN